MCSLVRRPFTANSYELTTRYRLYREPARRIKSGVVSRRRKREDFGTISEDQESIRTLVSTIESIDFDREVDEECDFISM